MIDLQPKKGPVPMFGGAATRKVENYANNISAAAAGPEGRSLTCDTVDERNGELNRQNHIFFHLYSNDLWGTKVSKKNQSMYGKRWKLNPRTEVSSTGDF